MEWIELTKEESLVELKEESLKQPVLIFKHSTRCSISSTALNRLERSWDESKTENLKCYFLDLIAYRSISNKIAHDFNIEHESPQALLISNGKCIFHSSHLGINYNEISTKSSEVKV